MNWPLATAKMTLIHPGRTVGPMYGKVEAREKIADFFPRLRPELTATWLLTIAELHPIKRHPVLIDAVVALHATHPRLRLIIIGDGELRAALEAKVREVQAESYIFIVGAITEAARFLKAADAFALASQSESYGYVLHEAGLAGVPIVATNVGGIPDIITHQETGLLVPPNDVRALADALASLLTNDATAKQYAAALATRLERRGVTAMTTATTAVYTLPL